MLAFVQNGTFSFRNENGTRAAGRIAFTATCSVVALAITGIALTALVAPGVTSGMGIASLGTHAFASITAGAALAIPCVVVAGGYRPSRAQQQNFTSHKGSQEPDLANEQSRTALIQRIKSKQVVLDIPLERVSDFVKNFFVPLVEALGEDAALKQFIAEKYGPALFAVAGVDSDVAQMLYALDPAAFYKHPRFMEWAVQLPSGSLVITSEQAQEKVQAFTGEPEMLAKFFKALVPELVTADLIKIRKESDFTSIVAFWGSTVPAYATCLLDTYPGLVTSLTPESAKVVVIRWEDKLPSYAKTLINAFPDLFQYLHEDLHYRDIMLLITHENAKKIRFSQQQREYFSDLVRDPDSCCTLFCEKMFILRMEDACQENEWAKNIPVTKFAAESQASILKPFHGVPSNAGSLTKKEQDDDAFILDFTFKSSDGKVLGLSLDSKKGEHKEFSRLNGGSPTRISASIDKAGESVNVTFSGKDKERWIISKNIPMTAWAIQLYPLD